MIEQLIAKALHVDEAWLIGHDVPMSKETFTQNLLGLYRDLDDKG